MKAVYVFDDDQDRLERAAKKRGVSVEELIEEILDEMEEDE